MASQATDLVWRAAALLFGCTSLILGWLLLRESPTPAPGTPPPRELLDEPHEFAELQEFLELCEIETMEDMSDAFDGWLLYEAQKAWADPNLEIVGIGSGQVADISGLESAGRAPGTTDAEWRRIVQWTRRATSPVGGPDRDHAANELVRRGKKAFPAILHAVSQLDLRTEEGSRQADLCHDLLTRICNGRMYSWRSGADPGHDAAVNSRTIKQWHREWERVLEWEAEHGDDRYWRKLTYRLAD